MVTTSHVYMTQSKLHPSISSGAKTFNTKKIKINSEARKLMGALNVFKTLKLLVPDKMAD